MQLEVSSTISGLLPGGRYPSMLTYNFIESSSNDIKCRRWYLEPNYVAIDIGVG